MPRYSIMHPKYSGCVGVAVYGLPGADGDGVIVSVLRAVEFNQGCHPQFIRAVVTRLPGLIEQRGAENGLAFVKLKIEGCVVRDVTEKDLSFETFWREYGYKVGDKKRVQRKWEALGEGERLLALGGIWKQRRHSEGHGAYLPYPETYLNQRRWENEYN